MVEYIIITFPSLKVMYCKTTWLIQRKFSLSFMWLLCLLWKTVGHFGYVGQLETNQTSGCVTQQKEWWEYSDWRYPVNSVDSYQAGLLDIKFPAALFRPATKQWRRSKGLLELKRMLMGTMDNSRSSTILLDQRSLKCKIPGDYWLGGGQLKSCNENGLL